MLTVSPSISPLSYKSSLISPASVSISFTVAFVRLVSTGGGAGKTVVLLRIKEVSDEGISTCLFAIGIGTVSFFAGGGLVFFGGGFEAVNSFLAATDFLGVGAADGGFTHSRKVISSRAK